jgi:hypothetical protein
MATREESIMDSFFISVQALHLVSVTLNNSQVFLTIWLVLPERLLDQYVVYYPDKYNSLFIPRRWAIVIPIYILGLIPFVSIMFLGINLIRIHDVNSIYTITGTVRFP